jgi:heme-degrading monooxygenase HmoA
MVRVIIEYKAKNVEKLIDIIREVRTEAMKQHGYIIGETLVSADDPNYILVISTWDTLDDWKAWDSSETRLKLKPRINELLTEPHSSRTFHYYLLQQKGIRTIF